LDGFNLILVKFLRMLKRNVGKVRNHSKYKRKVKNRLKNIQSGIYISVGVAVLIGMLFVGKITGFVVGDSSGGSGFGFILIIGFVLSMFVFREKIKKRK